MHALVSALNYYHTFICIFFLLSKSHSPCWYLFEHVCFIGICVLCNMKKKNQISVGTIKLLTHAERLMRNNSNNYSILYGLLKRLGTSESSDNLTDPRSFTRAIHTPGLQKLKIVCPTGRNGDQNFKDVFHLTLFHNDAYE